MTTWRQVAAATDGVEEEGRRGRTRRRPGFGVDTLESALGDVFVAFAQALSGSLDWWYC